MRPNQRAAFGGALMKNVLANPEPNTPSPVAEQILKTMSRSTDIASFPKQDEPKDRASAPMDLMASVVNEPYPTQYSWSFDFIAGGDAPPYFVGLPMLSEQEDTFLDFLEKREIFNSTKAWRYWHEYLQCKTKPQNKAAQDQAKALMMLSMFSYSYDMAVKRPTAFVYMPQYQFIQYALRVIAGESVRNWREFCSRFNPSEEMKKEWVWVYRKDNPDEMLDHAPLQGVFECIVTAVREKEALNNDELDALSLFLYALLSLMVAQYGKNIGSLYVVKLVKRFLPGYAYLIERQIDKPAIYHNHEQFITGESDMTDFVYAYRCLTEFAEQYDGDDNFDLLFTDPLTVAKAIMGLQGGKEEAGVFLTRDVEAEVLDVIDSLSDFSESVALQGEQLPEGWDSQLRELVSEGSIRTLDDYVKVSEALAEVEVDESLVSMSEASKEQLSALGEKVQEAMVAQDLELASELIDQAKSKQSELAGKIQGVVVEHAAKLNDLMAVIGDAFSCEPDTTPVHEGDEDMHQYLLAEVEECQGKLASQVAENHRLKHENDYLRQSHAGGISGALEAALFGHPSIADVLAIIRQTYPSVVFADDIDKQVEKCVYGSPKKLLKHLHVLCGSYYQALAGGQPDSVAKQLFGDKVYRSGESESCRNSEKLMS